MTYARAILPAVTALLIGSVVSVTLLQRPANVMDRPVAPIRPGARIQPMDLGAVRLSDGTRLAQLGLKTGVPEFLLSHERVLLFVTTFETQPRLIDGLLRVEGAACVFETLPGASLRNNTYLAFERSPDCRIPVGTSLSGRVDVTIRYTGLARVGIVADLANPARLSPEWLRLAVHNALLPEGMPIVRARYANVPDGEPLRRVDLLAAMWNFPGAVGLIWTLLAMALLLIAGGTAVLLAEHPRSRAGLIPELPRSRPALERGCSAGAAGAVAVGLALCYAVLVPPLHGPDEPDHLMTLAAGVGRPELAIQTEALAKAGHFDRIHRVGEERFRTGDVGHPAVVAWDPRVILPNDIAKRSVTTWAWWNLLGPLSRPFDVAGSLLLVRLANALLFGLSVAVAILLLKWTDDEGHVTPEPVALALLLVPTLPFFATHVSEFAVLTSIYIVLAGTVAALFLDGRRAYALGFPLGLAISLILASGRSALPLVPALVAIAAGRAIIGSAHHTSSRAAARVFWAGLGLGLLVFPLISTQEFRAGVWPLDSSKVPDWIRPYAEFLRRYPAVTVLLAPVGFAIERVMEWYRAQADRRRAGWMTLALRAGCVVTAVAVLGSLAWSLVVRFPAMATLEAYRPETPAGYVAETFRVVLTGLRLADHDFLMSWSFWGGFGWLDAVPPAWFISIVVLLHALAGVVLLIRLARAPEWRRPAWLVVLGTGWVASLALYAVSSYILNRNLHGRYLLGLYLIVLAVSWCAAVFVPAVRRERSRLGPGRITGFLLVTAACFHAFALRIILTRYF